MGKVKYHTTKLVIHLGIYEATSDDMGHTIPTGPRYVAEHHITADDLKTPLLSEDELIGLETVRMAYKIQKDRRWCAEFMAEFMDAEKANKTKKKRK